MEAVLSSLFLLILSAAEAQFQNCFELEDRWNESLSFNESTASITFDLDSPAVLDCLEGQKGYSYKIRLLKDGTTFAEKLKPVPELNNEIIFRYIIEKGQYGLAFGLCTRHGKCNENTEVGSPRIVLESSLIFENCSEDEQFRDFSSFFDENNFEFKFTYAPCTRIFPYESSRVILYQKPSNGTTDSCDELEGGEVLEETEVKPISLNANLASIRYKPSIKFDDDHYYCVVVESDHGICEMKDECRLISGPIYVKDSLYITKLIPYCTSHFRCGWIYILVFGSVIFLISFILAIICLYCCCRRSRREQKRHILEAEVPFEGVCLQQEEDRVITKTWAQLHAEWDVEPPKNPGKILILYSRDSETFQELQTAFKSFLECACHCVVLDLFDDDLFQQIAFDPEQWIRNLLQDPDFKIIVICSQGAAKRQRALSGDQVLNIPNNSNLDGLFSAGLKFILDNHANDQNRLATARYEMLSLTGPEYKFQGMLQNPEFMIPTQLHDLFCWIHGYEPLNLLGKPWDRYHLELQLLQDALRKSRMDKRTTC